MYQDTITLFNRTGEKWKAIVLPHVDLNADQAAIIAKYGAESKDKASLHVRFTPTASGDSVKGVNSKLFAVKGLKEYAGNEGTIAFRPAASGEVVDFFMVGEWDGEDTINDSDFNKGFYNYMSATRDGVYTVTSVARYSVIPHFEILGR